MIFACGDEQSPEYKITITRHSDIYWENGNWHCPLCDSIVTNRDRSGIPPELYLQEWHDNFLDEDYFDEKICNISDEELFASIDLNRADLSHLKKLIKKEMFDTAVLEFTRIFKNKTDEFRLYSYPGFNDISLQTFDEFLNEAEKFVEKKNAIIQEARNIADPQKGYTINGIHFGDKVNFNKDVDGKSKIKAVSFSYGLNFLCAYFFTNDSFYLKSLEDLFNQIYSFRAKMTGNKKYNPIWYELGIAGRITRLVDIYRLAGLMFSAGTQKNLLKFILGQARWLHQALIQNPFHDYNWQTANAASLGYTALLFPEFKESKQWLADSKRYMTWHFENTFLDDGGHCERSVSYAKYTFSICYRYIMLMKYFDNDLSWGEKYLPTLEKMVEFYTLIHSPIGTCCPFNDAARDKDKYVDFFSETAHIFNRGDFLGPILEHVPGNRRKSYRVKPRIPEILSHNFASSQYAVMRGNWNPDTYFLLMNYGPFRNHAHYDALDFEIYANGIPIAIDAGIGSAAYSDSLHSTWYKHPHAHNMLIVDDAVFNKRKAAGKNVVWISQNMTDYFAATHEGYKEINGTVHRRHIAFIKNKYWLIFDQVWTEQPNLALTWNFHSPLHFSQVQNGFDSKESPGAVVLSVPDTLIATEIKKGMADLRGIENEPDHREIDWLIFSKANVSEPGVNEFVILTYPKKDGNPQIVFERLKTEAPAVHGFRIKYANNEDWIFFSDGSEQIFSDTIEGDFSFGWFNLVNNKIKSVSIGDLTKVEIKELMSLTLSQRNNYENTF